MTKEGIISGVARETGLPKQTCAEVLDAALSLIANELKKGNTVCVGRKFGTFIPKHMPPCAKIVHGIPMDIPACRKVKFRPSVRLTALLNEESEDRDDGGAQ